MTGSFIRQDPSRQAKKHSHMDSSTTNRGLVDDVIAWLTTDAEPECKLSVDRVLTIVPVGEDGFASEMLRVDCAASAVDDDAPPTVLSFLLKCADSSRFPFELPYSFAVTEAEFYRCREITARLGAHTTLHLPRVYGARLLSRTASQLALEFLCPPGWHLGPAALTASQVRSATVGLAQMHSHFARATGAFSLESCSSWLQPAATHLGGYADLFTSSLGKLTAEKVREVVPALACCAEKVVEALCAVSYADLVETLCEAPPSTNDGSSVAHPLAAHLTLLHMDVRSKNMFFSDSLSSSSSSCSSSSPSCCLIDWQNVSRNGVGVLDIAYLFVGSLAVRTRLATESDLLALYHRHYSVEITLAELTRLYRVACLWPLVWAAATIADLDGLVSLLSPDSDTRQVAVRFMRTTTLRYLLAAFPEFVEQAKGLEDDS
mmetsp:Transcript_5528/g.13970  ORF Transcript_5528/g.13970 Transcript_5528/m.13970 type:complete len:433 (-) Transcript_5528:57-1355(-)|eukprot:CAMPEP_0174246668 /NCGR_PEP_ID=MMETSP0417-20130205/42187_1 /TAXON_ID=242541 /ORGANISM="Mayorella sp, Strain BSH-02190019" /LENGTH=432 /DNA_ID=CAMNT_0015326521 /DNA_START=1930 /DNA_END=3228 /DNA_ORIENTATION=+